MSNKKLTKENGTPAVRKITAAGTHPRPPPYLTTCEVNWIVLNMNYAARYSLINLIDLGKPTSTHKNFYDSTIFIYTFHPQRHSQFTLIHIRRVC
jgi:hypothetical protein